MSQATAIRYSKGFQFFDSEGVPLALGSLAYQVSGGGANQDTYSDSAGTVANTNPIVLDGSGRLTVDVYLGSTGLSPYRETLTDQNGATVSPWPDDNIPTATGYSGLSTDLSITLAASNAALNISTGNGVTLPGATDSLAGLLSAADKTKLDAIPPGYAGIASGVVIQNDGSSPNTVMDITTGIVVLVDNTGAATFVLSASGSVNLGTTGANALDTGAKANSTVYHLFQIWGSSPGTAFLASLSATAPTLPAGYTKFLRLGACIVDSSGNLYRTLQRGKDVQYKLTASTNTATFPLGASSASGAVASTLVNLAALVPATASKAVMAAFNGSGGGATFVGSNSLLAAATAGTVVGGATSSSTALAQTSCEVLMETASQCYWAVTAGLAKLFVLGWRDSAPVIS